MNEWSGGDPDDRVHEAVRTMNQVLIVPIAIFCMWVVVLRIVQLRMIFDRFDKYNGIVLSTENDKMGDDEEDMPKLPETMEVQPTPTYEYTDYVCTCCK